MAQVPAPIKPLETLGDIGNVAAKLEGRTKDLDCTLIASLAVLELAGLIPPGTEVNPIEIEGKAKPVVTIIFRSKSELQLLFPTQPPA